MSDIIDPHASEVARLRAELAEATRERDEARAALEQERVRLAGCLTAVEGWGVYDELRAKPDAYGWSLPYQKTLELRRAYDRVRAALEGTPENLDAIGHVIATRYHQLTSFYGQANAVLTALRERCFGAAPTGDEGKEGERG